MKINTGLRVGMILIAICIYLPIILGANSKAGMGQKLIPAGFFTPLYSSEKEEGPVKVDSFYMDVYAVSNAEFAAFIKKSPRWNIENRRDLFAEKSYLNHWQTTGSDNHHPVVNVSWFAARAYCAAQGRRLPTVLEWEYVAQAGEKSLKEKNLAEKILAWYSKTGGSQPKRKSGFKNYYGIWDLHGVIWEWTEDFNNALVTGESRGDSEIDRKLYCGGGSQGAADFNDYASFMRYGFRSSLEARFCVPNLGFRCANDK